MFGHFVEWGEPRFPHPSSRNVFLLNFVKGTIFRVRRKVSSSFGSFSSGPNHRSSSAAVFARLHTCGDGVSGTSLSMHSHEYPAADSSIPSLGGRFLKMLSVFSVSRCRPVLCSMHSCGPTSGYNAQRQFSELLVKAAGDYGALSDSIADLQWSNNFKHPPAVWGVISLSLSCLNFLR